MSNLDYNKLNQSSEEQLQLSDFRRMETSDIPIPHFQQPSHGVVTFQPGGFSANLYMMDALTQTTYNTIAGRHMSFVQLQGAIDVAGQQLQDTFRGRQAASQESMSYDQMLRSLLLKGEQVKQFCDAFWALQYSSVTFFDECMTYPFLTKPAGLILLTDKRLIIVSAQFNSSMALKEYGDPKKLPGGYSVSCSYQDNTFYLPIPLKNFHSVELNGSSGMAGTINITSERPCCNGLCGVFASCCPRATKQWTLGPLSSNQSRQLSIQMGVEMPPWGRKCFLVINLDPNVPVSFARDFIANVQQLAPNLM